MLILLFINPLTMNSNFDVTKLGCEGRDWKVVIFEYCNCSREDRLHFYFTSLHYCWTYRSPSVKWFGEWILITPCIDFSSYPLKIGLQGINAQQPEPWMKFFTSFSFVQHIIITCYIWFSDFFQSVAEIKVLVCAFVGTLLSDQKKGIVFNDPEFGNGER